MKKPRATMAGFFSAPARRDYQRPEPAGIGAMSIQTPRKHTAADNNSGSESPAANTDSDQNARRGRMVSGWIPDAVLGRPIVAKLR